MANEARDHLDTIIENIQATYNRVGEETGRRGGTVRSALSSSSILEEIGGLTFDNNEAYEALMSDLDDIIASGNNSREYKWIDSFWGGPAAYDRHVMLRDALGDFSREIDTATGSSDSLGDFYNTGDNDYYFIEDAQGLKDYLDTVTSSKLEITQMGQRQETDLVRPNSALGDIAPTQEGIERYVGLAAESETPGPAPLSDQLIKLKSKDVDPLMTEGFRQTSSSGGMKRI